MSVSDKTTTGYTKSVVTNAETKINTALREAVRKNNSKPESERLSDEELLFVAYKTAFKNVQETKTYPRPEVRSLILQNYLLANEELGRKMSNSAVLNISRYQEFSDCLPTTSEKNYAVRVAGKIYCAQGGGHCKLADDCARDTMKIISLPVCRFLNEVSPAERRELLHSMIKFAKHESSFRTRSERCEYSTLVKPVMSFTSPETLKGYAVRQAMPFVVSAYIKKSEEIASKNASDNGEQM